MLWSRCFKLLTILPKPRFFLCRDLCCCSGPSGKVQVKIFQVTFTFSEPLCNEACYKVRCLASIEKKSPGILTCPHYHLQFLCTLHTPCYLLQHSKATSCTSPNPRWCLACCQTPESSASSSRGQQGTRGVQTFALRQAWNHVCTKSTGTIQYIMGMPLQVHSSTQQHIHR